MRYPWKNNIKRPLICIIGASGSGKTTLAEKLEESFHLKSVSSYTTRPKRYEGEKGHTFITEEEYKQLENVVSKTYFNGYHYCVTTDMLDKADIFVVDIEGIKCLKESYNNRPFIVIYLKSDDKTRYDRMIMRNDNYQDAIDRIFHDQVVFKDAADYADYIIDASKTPQEVFDSVVKDLKL